MPHVTKVCSQEMRERKTAAEQEISDRVVSAWELEERLKYQKKVVMICQMSETHVEVSLSRLDFRGVEEKRVF